MSFLNEDEIADFFEEFNEEEVSAGRSRSPSPMQRFLQFMRQKLGLNLGNEEDNNRNNGSNSSGSNEASTSASSPPHERVLKSLTLDGVAEYILSGKAKNIIVMTGAGISTSAGIPDFRSPDTGIYSNLAKFNLPYPEAIFEIDYFRTNPEPFFELARSLYPGSYCPTPAHYFIKLLQNHGLLLRCFSQNIDMLERLAGIEDDKIVEAHGSFHTARCIDSDCRLEMSHSTVRELVFDGKIPRCANCDGLVKPDIVFFGEGLPAKFFIAAREDFDKCDLLIVMGTSLKVQPFAGLISRVRDDVPRVLLNMEPAGQENPVMVALGLDKGSFVFDGPRAYRDVFVQGPCDDSVLRFSELLGWKNEINDLIQSRNSLLSSSAAPEPREIERAARNFSPSPILDVPTDVNHENAHHHHHQPHHHHSHHHVHYVDTEKERRANESQSEQPEVHESHPQHQHQDQQQLQGYQYHSSLKANENIESENIVPRDEAEATATTKAAQVQKIEAATDDSSFSTSLAVELSEVEIDVKELGNL